MTLGSYDGAWYTEHSGTTYVIVSEILKILPALVRFDKLLQPNEGRWTAVVGNMVRIPWSPWSHPQKMFPAHENPIGIDC